MQKLEPNADLLVYEEAREVLDQLHAETLEYTDYCQLINALDYLHGLVEDKEAVIARLEKELNRRPAENEALTVDVAEMVQQICDKNGCESCVYVDKDVWEFPCGRKCIRSATARATLLDYYRYNPEQSEEIK